MAWCEGASRKEAGVRRVAVSAEAAAILYGPSSADGTSGPCRRRELRSCPCLRHQMEWRWLWRLRPDLPSPRRGGAGQPSAPSTSTRYPERRSPIAPLVAAETAGLLHRGGGAAGALRWHDGWRRAGCTGAPGSSAPAASRRQMPAGRAAPPCAVAVEALRPRSTRRGQPAAPPGGRTARRPTNDGGVSV